VKPREVLGRTQTPDGVELTLTRHVSEFAILANGQMLMSSRTHGTEDALAVIGCAHARTLPRPRVLIGGLGMGFTLRAALDVLPPAAEICQAELVPEVVAWNRGPLGHLAGHPLDDARVSIDERDVIAAMRSGAGRFDAVLMDVDNGPTALTTPGNVHLYSTRGLATARACLTPDGVLAFWSAQDDERFEHQLRDSGFSVQREHVRGHRKTRGSRHTILVARKRDGRG